MATHEEKKHVHFWGSKKPFFVTDKISWNMARSCMKGCGAYQLLGPGARGKIETITKNDDYYNPPKELKVL